MFYYFVDEALKKIRMCEKVYVEDNYRWLLAMSVNTVDWQLDHLHFIFVTVRRQLHYCMQRYVHIREFICDKRNYTLHKMGMSLT